MIANEQQRAIVSRQLGDLEEWRERVLHNSTQSPFQTRIEAAGIEKIIAHLQGEIDTYESAKALGYHVQLSFVTPDGSPELQQ
jgi:hypothetical protein